MLLIQWNTLPAPPPPPYDEAAAPSLPAPEPQSQAPLPPVSEDREIGMVSPSYIHQGATQTQDNPTVKADPHWGYKC